MSEIQEFPVIREGHGNLLASLGDDTDQVLRLAGESGAVSYGAQIGPSFVVTDGGESDTVLSGKVYGSVAATEILSVYGELSFAGGVDDADNGYGTKIGATWSF